MPIIYDDGSTGAASGAATGGFLDKINPFDQKSVDKANAATQEMLSAAKGGKFRISENGAQGIRKALQKMQSRLDDFRRDEEMLSQPPKLGTHEYGQRVAEHDVKSATGESGIVTRLNELRQILSDADEALKIAVENYRKYEDGATNAFRQGQA